MFTLLGKLNGLTVILRTLNKDGFSDIEQRAVEAMDKLLKCEEKIQHVPHIDLFKDEIRLTKHL